MINNKIEKIVINEASLRDALREYQIGLMKNQNHWHIRMNCETGECWVCEDTSYTIGCDEYEGKGNTKTILHQRGYGDYDTSNYESPEEQADDCDYDAMVESAIQEIKDSLYEGQDYEIV